MGGRSGTGRRQLVPLAGGSFLLHFLVLEHLLSLCMVSQRCSAARAGAGRRWPGDDVHSAAGKEGSEEGEEGNRWRQEGRAR